MIEKIDTKAERIMEIDLNMVAEAADMTIEIEVVLEEEVAKDPKGGDDCID